MNRNNKENKIRNNIAFIDGQNLYLGIKNSGWKINFSKFVIYLKDKYLVDKIYYFVGYFIESNIRIYKKLEDDGFVLIFKEHSIYTISKKKGNVDSDIVFEIMKNLIDYSDIKGIVLISGDGDYKKMVDYLILKNVFKKILFPNKKFASSLYRKLGSEYYDYIDNLKSYINEKGS